jgi:hypothetical protein
MLYQGIPLDFKSIKNLNDNREEAGDVTGQTPSAN